MSKYFLLLLLSFVLLIGCNNGKSGKTDESNNDTTNTIENLNKQIRENPKNAKLFVKRSEIYEKDGNIIEAINDLELAIKVDSMQQELYPKLSKLYLSTGNSGRAKDVLLKCLVRFPQNVQARIDLAYIYFYVQMYREAMTEIINLEKNNLQNAETFFLKALILNETEVYEEATKALKKAIEYDNKHQQAYNLIGLIYTKINNPIAIEYFNTAKRLFPNDTEILFNSGWANQEFKNYEKSIEDYKSVIIIDSLNYQAHYNLGYINVNFIKDYEAAVANFTSAILCDSSSYKAFYNRGFTYEKMKKYKLAELDYRKALEILPNYDPAVDGLNEVISK
jgi:tetratricopeptide (TPR) repeat protein